MNVNTTSSNQVSSQGYTVNQNNLQFILWNINKSKISFQQCQQRKPQGLMKFQYELLKTAFCYPANTHINFVNASFVTGTFPSLWKMAEVTPIPKEGDHKKPNNNRPVSLLPCLSKLCEKVALNQLVAFLESKQWLSTKQSGNKQFHLMEMSLIETTDVIII